MCDLCGRDFTFEFELIVHLTDHDAGLVKKVSKSCGKYKSKHSFVRLFILNNVASDINSYFVEPHCFLNQIIRQT